jgi:hypothetical protein
MNVRTQINGYRAGQAGAGDVSAWCSRCSTCGRTAAGANAVEVTRAVVQSFARRLLDQSGGQAEPLLVRAMTAAARAARSVDRGITLATAVRTALKRTFPELPQDEWLGELEDEIRRPLKVTLRWSSPLTRKQIIDDRLWDQKGGVYIKMDGGKPSKVGKASRFIQRLKERDYRNATTSRFYLAKITAAGEKDPVGILEAVEHAVARTLLRMGKELPDHSVPGTTLTAGSKSIEITNVVPSVFVRDLPTAYTQFQPLKHPKGRFVREQGEPAGVPGNPVTLVITPSMKWEA